MTTLSTVLSTGNGTLEYGLFIEGCPFAFVTCERLTGIDASFVTASVGLTRNGLSTGFTCDLPNARVDGSSVTFTIMDDSDGNTTRAFCKKPDATTFLLNNIGPSDTVLKVSDTANFPAGTYAFFGQEAVLVSSVNTSSIGEPQLNVQRNRLNSQAKGWYAFFPGIPTGVGVRISNYPRSMYGRRVELRAFSNSDPLDTTGNVLWRGTVSAEPSMQNGGTWKLPCVAVTEKLKQKFGQKLDSEFKLRGIHHPVANPFHLVLQNWRFNVGSGSLPYVMGPAILSASIQVRSNQSFYETRDDFLGDINAALAATTAVSWATQPRFVWGYGGDLQLQFTLTGSFVPSVGTGSLEYIECAAQNGIQETWLNTATSTRTRTVGFENFPRKTGNPAISQAKFYAFPFHGTPGDPTLNGIGFPHQLPELFNRGQKTMVICTQDPDVLGNPSPAVPIAYPMAAAPITAFVGPDVPPTDARTLHLTPAENIPGITSNLEFEINLRRINYDALPFNNDTTNEVVEGAKINLPISSLNTTTGEVIVNTNDLENGIASQVITDSDKINLSAQILGNGNFPDFIAKVVALSPPSSSLGVYPDLTTTDIDLTAIRTLWTASFPGGADSYYANRNYTFYQESTLEEIFSEECKILGWFMTVDDTKISMVEHRERSVVEPGAFVINKSNAITQGANGDWFTFNRATGRFINQITLKGQLNQKEDIYLQTNNTRYMPSISDYGGRTNSLKIEPKSTEIFQQTQDQWKATADAVTKRLYRTFGFYKDALKVQVPMSAFSSLQLGATAFVSMSQIPNTLGLRPSNILKSGLVKGVTWDHNIGVGTVDMMLETTDNGAGYSPTVAVKTASQIIPTLYSFSLEQARYSYMGETDLQWFRVGDKVEVRKWNAWESIVASGTISSTGSNSMIILFPAVPPTALFSLNNISGARIGFESTTGSNIQTNQFLYSYIYSGSNFGVLGPITIESKNVLR